MATLGINPSSGEFLDRSGRLLDGELRRLATRESLAVGPDEALTEVHAAEVVDDCAAYFHRRPYRWFDVLDRVLREGVDCSYFDDTACHLDLVQWATDPLWGKLTESARTRLLSEDLAFLRRQLAQEQYQVVLVNGRTAADWVERSGIVSWRSVGALTGPPTATLYTGAVEGVRFLAWSCNLQSQHGAPRHIPALIDFVQAHVDA